MSKMINMAQKLCKPPKSRRKARIKRHTITSIILYLVVASLFAQLCMLEVAAHCISKFASCKASQTAIETLNKMAKVYIRPDPSQQTLQLSWAISKADKTTYLTISGLDYILSPSFSLDDGHTWSTSPFECFPELHLDTPLIVTQSTTQSLERQLDKQR